MRLQSSTKYLLGTASVLVLSTAALVAAAQPANAQATKGIYMGGSTLASEAFRQVLDCYTGTTVGGDNFAFSSSFPGAGFLPTTCTTAPLKAPTVQGMYAGVGSGNGFRGYIANNAAQWYGGTVTAGQVISTPSFVQPPFPALQPPFVDSANSANFGSYPYPRVDIGLSDSPLAATVASLTTVSFTFSPTTWASAATNATSTVTVGTTTQVAAYSTATYGQPIQIPAFEVNVAIPVNVNSTSFQINSQVTSGGTIVTGGAIQLTEAQLCAVFSGLVTDWSDTSTDIPYANQNGPLDTTTTPPTQLTQKFSAANISSAHPGSQAYSSTSLPIKVVYRTDGSGTSFILTNYLKAVCPLLDPNGTYKYAAIFGASNLPNTTFANLITNVNANRTNGSTITGAWVGASGSGGVAAGVNNDTTNAGNIGYVSADFTKPYAIASTAPYSASLQDENQRINGVTLPSTTVAGLTFVPPTPASADLAWSDTRLQAPAATWTYNDYNIYGNTFTTTTQGGVNVTGLSVLPLNNVAGAYPLSGTTFMALYSCYNVQSDSARVTNLRNFLNWYINGADSGASNYDADVAAVVQNNGFHLVPVNYAQNIVNQYLTTTSSSLIKAAAGGVGGNSQGCSGVTGGAAGGAK
jgi:ABC-type phosphate transport system substrate-binding protein